MQILLADDHAIVRSGLRGILAGEFPSADIGEASSCAEVLSKIGEKGWDLLVLDIAMGSKNSLDILPEIKTLRPDMPVLMLSMYNEQQFIIKALQLGADGYLTKEKAPDELISAIHKIFAAPRQEGGSPAVKAEADPCLKAGAQLPHKALSVREYEVFLMIAAGMSLTEVAKKLSVSAKTVSTYRSRILVKMGINSNAELVRYAFKHNLVK